MANRKKPKQHIIPLVKLCTLRKTDPATARMIDDLIQSFSSTLFLSCPLLRRFGLEHFIELNERLFEIGVIKILWDGKTYGLGIWNGTKGYMPLNPCLSCVGIDKCPNPYKPFLDNYFERYFDGKE